MSYLVLARKWRPQSFDEVVGQEPVVRTLRNALSRKRVAHAMLFSGVRGVGKTTLARLMAKALNCREGEPDAPCNRCESCVEITAGAAIDLHEIDGASNRGIQEIRELKENIRFLPAKSTYKIIIIDEVHMLTAEAFNALLKTLEEPPAHVYFMFATTELHKIPITILSRCQRYELKRVPFHELVAFFGRISGEEGIEVSGLAVEMIAREAQGSIRDGLSLLDQVFSFGGDTVTDADVTQVLGLVDRQVFARLAKALLTADLEQSLSIFDKGCAAGIDLKRFVNDLLEYFRSLMVCRISRHPGELLDVSDQELAACKEIAGEYSAETLYNCFNLLLKGIEEMQYSSRPRLVLEMAFIKATQAGQIAPVASVLARLDEVLHATDRASGAYPPANGTRGPQSTCEPLPTLPAAASSRPEEPATVSASKKTDGQALPAKEPGQPAAADFQAREKDVRRNWDDFIGYVKKRKPWMASMLGLCAGGREEGDALILEFDDADNCKALKEQENARLFTEFAQDFFQKGLKLKLGVRGGGASGNDGENALIPQEERRALANDPLVRMTAEIFGGQVVGVRTGPRSR